MFMRIPLKNGRCENLEITSLQWRPILRDGGGDYPKQTRQDDIPKMNWKRFSLKNIKPNRLILNFHKFWK